MILFCHVMCVSLGGCLGEGAKNIHTHSTHTHVIHSYTYIYLLRTDDDVGAGGEDKGWRRHTFIIYTSIYTYTYPSTSIYRPRYRYIYYPPPHTRTDDIGARGEDEVDGGLWGGVLQGLV